MLTLKYGNRARTILGQNVALIRQNYGMLCKSDFQEKLKQYNALLRILISHLFYTPKLLGRCESVYIQFVFICMALGQENIGKKLIVLNANRVETTKII